MTPPAGKRAGTVVHSTEPLNCEPAPAALAAGSLTATDAFYVRSHGPVPAPVGEEWTLAVGGLVDRPLAVGLPELRAGAHGLRDVAATLQCAGNRRAGLIAVRDIPGEAPWGPGATGTASWLGCSLGELLRAAGPRPEAAHVVLVGRDAGPEAGEPYEVSIPLAKALREEVLVAWEMNGAPLEPAHGAPLRVVVPGYIGARSVKWLESIELRAEPSRAFFQDVAYRLLAPEEEPAPGRGVELGEVGLNSELLVPAEGEEVAAGRVVLRGYAFAGGERHITRVDVSVDGGVRWRQAALGDDLGRWAWRLWSLEAELEPGEHEVRVRAWDSAAATQPERAETVWNPKGYVNNAQTARRLRVA